MKLLMALEAVRQGPEHREWHPAAVTERTLPDDKISDVRALLDDCVSSMVVATLPEDYEHPFVWVDALQAAGEAVILDSGTVYAKSVDALCALFDKTIDSMFPDAPEDIPGMERRYVRVLATLYRTVEK